MNIAIAKPKLGKAAQSFLSGKHRMLIDGKWVDAQSGKTFAVEDPATQEMIAHVAEGDEADIDLAVAAARRAFETRAVGDDLPAERAKLVWRLGDLLEQHADEFAELEALDNGKPVTAARRGDVGGSIDMFRYMAGWATRLTGETIPVSSPGNWLAYTLREPVGVVGQIIPWNFPLMMAAWKLAPALAAGCTIVLKPAEQTPLSALRLGELIMEAGFPEGVVNIVTGFGETAGAALADASRRRQGGVHRLDRGRQADRQGGGRQPEARVAWSWAASRRRSSSPTPSSTTRSPARPDAIFYNHGPVLHRRLAAVRAQEDLRQDRRRPDREAGKLKIGHGLDPSDQLGPLVSDGAAPEGPGLSRIRPQARAPRWSTGGGAIGNRGYFVQPTVLANTNRDMKVVREEIFGPVVCVQPFEDDDLDCGRQVRQRHRVRPAGEHLDPQPDASPTRWRARSRPARSASTPTTRATPPGRSAASSSPAGAARWARKSWSTTPRQSRRR